jgi:hypothetical protein
MAFSMHFTKGIEKNRCILCTIHRFCKTRPNLSCVFCSQRSTTGCYSEEMGRRSVLFNGLTSPIWRSLERCLKSKTTHQPSTGTLFWRHRSMVSTILWDIRKWRHANLAKFWALLLSRLHKIVHLPNPSIKLTQISPPPPPISSCPIIFHNVHVRAT